MRLSALVVPREKGETARQRLIELDLLHKGAKMRSDEKHVYLPLKSLPDETTPLPPHSITVLDFEEVIPRKTVEDLLGYTPPHDIIGDLAVLNTTSPSPEAEADALLRTHKHLRGVFQSTAPLSGEFRTRILRHVKGVQRTRTLYREHGLSYELDIAQVYFTPRLATERLRVAERITGGVVVDMFAGIGPFSLLIAKKQPRTRSVAVDKNRHAVNYLKRNIQRNKTWNVDAVLADSKHLPLKDDIAEHIIMNLPHSAHRFLPEAIRILKHRGVLYYYDITPADDLYHTSIQEIHTQASQLGFRIEVLAQRNVRSYSPHHYNICIEARIHKTPYGFE